MKTIQVSDDAHELFVSLVGELNQAAIVADKITLPTEPTVISDDWVLTFALFVTFAAKRQFSTNVLVAIADATDLYLGEKNENNSGQ